ncbi:MAG: fatty acid kinase [Actinomycetota bacterium]|nr:fatty acid kinase [Actinomycetota bacterium]
MLDALDADAVRRWYRWGVQALDATREEINSLNVFPVADADTGTNLHLTLASAMGPADEWPADADVTMTATSMARLCLLGARGSSGVILSQLLRGVAEVLSAGRRPLRGLVLTEALERAVALAYAAVSQPVEGTMLTVARAASEAARATGSDQLHVVVAAAVSGAREALEHTPDQLEVLRRAGVVDAGGRGVVVLLDVLLAVVEDRPFVAPESRLASPRVDSLDASPGSALAPVPAYEVMYLIDADDDRIPHLREALDLVGDSVVVSGGDGLWNVHVHTDDPDAALAAGVAAGEPHSIRATRIGPHTEDPGQGHGRHGHERLVVVVLEKESPALAIRGLLENAGARVIEGISPASVTDEMQSGAVTELVFLVEASEALETQVRHAAAQLDPVAGARAYFIRMQAPVQMLSAVAVHDPHRPFDDDAGAMARATAATRHAQIGPSADDPDRFAGVIGDAKDGGSVLTVAGDDPTELAVAVIDEMLAREGGELVTVVSEVRTGNRIAARLAAMRPELDVNQLPADGLGSVVWLGVE